MDDNQNIYRVPLPQINDHLPIKMPTSQRQVGEDDRSKALASGVSPEQAIRAPNKQHGREYVQFSQGIQKATDSGHCQKKRAKSPKFSTNAI